MENSSELGSNLYEKMLYTYESDSVEAPYINIGFDRLSRAFEQCSAFPLAIGNSSENSIQPLIHISKSSLPIDADLCADKSGYFVDLPEAYPLQYDLALIYQKGSEAGEAVRKTFLTHEAQYLMSEVGLAPLTPTPILWSFIWGSNAEKK